MGLKEILGQVLQDLVLKKNHTKHGYTESLKIIENQEKQRKTEKNKEKLRKNQENQKKKKYQEKLRKIKKNH